ncbi:MAG TPA: PxKF domain-containing protein, partial [Acidimicrobiales bacterium]
YSYVFDGQWGYLDHALASASLVDQVDGVADYHINSDEPSVLDYNVEFKSAGQVSSLYAPDQFRVSDHDPVIIGLTPNAPPSVDAGGPYTVEEGEVVTLSATGSDPNGDSLTYAWDLDNDGTFETPGQSVTLTAPAAPATLTVRVRATDTGGLSATDAATVNVIWRFSGFFSPIDNLPTVNLVKAGQAVPVKFGLLGDQGLGVLAAGSPTVSGPVPCASPSAGAGAAAESAGGSRLQYDPLTDRYTWVWKTDRAWADTCRILTVTLVDGTAHQALFHFTR